MNTIIKPLKNIKESEFVNAGGKAGALAKMAQAGFPVPDGFVIFPESFKGDELPPEAAQLVYQQLFDLRAMSNARVFAVRSSAFSEDSAQASFAGEFESFLNLRSDEEVIEGIHKVRRSASSERVQSYSQAKGMGYNHEIAVIVQKMVPSKISGVLFTADPLKGSRLHMVGNFVHGLGESLVSGASNAETFTINYRTGSYSGPNELKPFARKLFRMGKKLEKLFGTPQDIEWAIAGKRLYILQSRSVTTMIAHDPQTGTRNDSLVGDYLWGNANFSEAVPDVTTPFTWSALTIFHTINPYRIMADYTGIGNIYGHPYLNLSLLMSLYRTMGIRKEKALNMISDINGKLPEGVEIPLIPLTKFELFKNMMLQAAKQEIYYKRYAKDINPFLKENPADCLTIREQIKDCSTNKDLLDHWHIVLHPFYVHACWMLRTATEDFIRAVYGLRTKLTKLVGELETNELLQFSKGSELASLGPLVGLVRVAKGEMSQEDYLQDYGHRSAYEFELSKPSPMEIPGWLEDQLGKMTSEVLTVEEQLNNQDQISQRAWALFVQRYPGKAPRFEKMIKIVEERSCCREAVRSEFTRSYSLLRTYALRVADLTGIGEEVFFLKIKEICSLLQGDRSALSFVESRIETHQRYSTLPPLPAFIRGRFDAFQWADDPHRRNDVFDPALSRVSSSAVTITGFAGAAGRVEGKVRILQDPEEGDALLPGEILVTNKTNIGWTLLFTKASAIVTDIGAPLSHAAIVARELGIPAVVGCADATQRLKTGDKVLVDGAAGVVEIIIRKD